MELSDMNYPADGLRKYFFFLNNFAVSVSWTLNHFQSLVC